MTRQRKIRLLLWTYFWLLIFEGALRKWVLPGFSNALLVVRDPVCLAAIIVGWPYLFQRAARVWIVPLWTIALMALVAAATAGHGDLITALFGARILLLHFPLVFLFASVFTSDDIWRFARWTLALSIPMTALIIAQYSLPSEHIVNIAPGGEGTAGFSGALGRLRPPGTFSFITGLSSFYGLAAAFFAGWLACGPKPIPRWIWVSAACLLFALPFSISRTLLFYYLLVAACAAFAGVLAGSSFRGLGIGFSVLAVFALIFSQLEFFQEAQTVFSARWENARISEAGDAGVGAILAKRVGGTLLEAFKISDDVGLLGKGIGLGTNVGAMRATGEKGFVVAEGAWPAIVGECGPLVGFALILWRIALAANLGLLSIFQALKANPLPVIFAGLALQGLVIGQTSQPTALGFVVVCTGFMFAACNRFSTSSNGALRPISAGSVPSDHPLEPTSDARACKLL
jgi:hypothetical protein